MIDFYFWTTPNGYKVMLFLEETGIPYRVIPVNISKGEQFDAQFLEISPNNRIPAIVDQTPVFSNKSIPIFESGAILLYLAEKTSRFLPSELATRTETLQWLFWQMGGLGPMLGQSLHFSAYAPERIPYAIDRYANESQRLYRVLDQRLADREFIAGDYSIADMASYPWIRTMEAKRPDLDRFGHLKRWYESIGARPGTHRAYNIGASVNTTPTVTEEAKKILFGQEIYRAAA